MLLTKRTLRKHNKIAGFALLVIASPWFLLDPNFHNILSQGLMWSSLSIMGSVWFGAAIVAFFGKWIVPDVKNPDVDRPYRFESHWVNYFIWFVGTAFSCLTVNYLIKLI